MNSLMKYWLAIGCFLMFTTLYAQVDFPLFKEGKVATIYVAKNESPQVLRAVKDLQKDIETVTGSLPAIVHQIKDVKNKHVIAIGTHQSKWVTKFHKEKLLDETKGLEAMKQSFLLKSVASPFKNTDNVLSVVGSDPLGAVYGIYEISERIGVSPLYWWCDVKPQKQSEIVLKKVLETPKEPSVEYRGIFINDEEALTQWSKNTSPNKTNTHPSPAVYKRVFELLLRLKANAIWPAMMHRSSYFFEAKDENGVPINPKNAKEYGIWVGASHCEQMGRNNYDEWYDWAAAHKDMYDAVGEPLWDYTVNPKAIEAYWQERLDESKDFNMIYTMGIRGVHDSPFRYDNMENPTLEKKVALLQKVIDRQREMIKNTFGAEDAVPQIFVPYEETGEIYNGESKDGKEKCKGLELPEDIMMVWTEDNFAHARQLSTPKEQQRKGGNGIYYHIAYQGWPTTYDWLYTTPMTIMQEELRKVYNNNARKFWIVNVGDIKPAEMGLQFFMSLAYNIDSYDKNETKDFLTKSAQQQFAVAEDQASEIADLITDFQQFAWAKKPEVYIPFWDWEYKPTWMYQFHSLFDFGDEAQKRMKKIAALEQKAKAIYDSLDASSKNTFWHLAYYPIRSTHLMFKKAIYYRKNVAYAKQGRFASVNAYAALSKQAEAAIQTDLKHYKQMVNGKWNGIMDPYADYNEEERVIDVANIPNNLVYDEKFLEEAVTGIGAVCEGQEIGHEKVTLQFSSLEDNQRFVDVFNRELKANDWELSSNVDWIQFTQQKGQVVVEQRIWASVDWNKVKVGKNKATITVKDARGFSKSFPVLATKFDLTPKEKSYVEGNGFLAVEAENFAAKFDGEKGAKWQVYNNYGHNKSSVFVKGGAKVEKDIEDKGARLEYRVYFESTGTFYGELYRLPTLNEGKGKTCEVAIGVDNETPKVLSGVRNKGGRKSTQLSDGKTVHWSWYKNVLALMERIPFEITVDKPGYHTFKIYQVNTDIGIDRFVICTNQEAAKIQRNSLLGATESYNTFDGVKEPLGELPTIVAEQAAVKPYPKPAPLTEAKLNFALYAMVEDYGFTPVNQRHVFNPNKNQFGWRAQDVKKIGIHHDESSNRVPFWQRDGLTGKKEAKFYVKLKKGTYKVKYYMGDSRNREEEIYSKAKKFTINFKINGKTLLKNEDTVPGIGQQIIKNTIVNVGDDELLEVVISGNWILNALEIAKQ
ncbi:glycosyl hydrolase 115 family protein [Ochrovirga pacifica]|uniref:glycosyl hydrolase 115 family protein n=1 Tax=Ochrovirga pacifica TaxID=1042376 RepID=UPI0002F8C96D|nr:glycosyl hydrolase 115 family protein [Ochrovirga pacifica]